jgi:hypothetical protein
MVFSSIGSADAKPSGCKVRAVVEKRAVTAWTADRLRKQPSTTRGARPDELLLGDGRVMVQDGAGSEGAIYTPEAFKLRRAQLDEDLRFRHVAAGESFHLLRSLIDDGENFVAHVPSLVGDFKRRLANEGISGSGAELATRMAAHWRDAGCRLDPTLFREMTAWAGDLAIERAGGRWSTQTGDFAVVEPVIESGKLRLAPWAWVSALLDGSATDLEPLIAADLAPPAPLKAVAASAPEHPERAGEKPLEHPSSPEAPRPSLNSDEKIPDSLKLLDPGF